MAGIFIALISGALMSIQGIFNTEVTKQSSVWLAAAWVQFTALAVCVALWLFTGRENVQTLWHVRPWYMLLGGVMGAGITWTVIQSMGSLGPAQATLLIVISQILVSYGVELFGMFGVEQVGFQWRKLIGAVIAIAGIVLFRWE